MNDGSEPYARREYDFRLKDLEHRIMSLEVDTAILKTGQESMQRTLTRVEEKQDKGTTLALTSVITALLTLGAVTFELLARHS
jgi:hypothetical protein